MPISTCTRSPGGMKTGAKKRPNGRKRSYRFQLPSVRTLRFERIHLPARVARDPGRSELRITAARSSRRRTREIECKLAA